MQQLLHMNELQEKYASKGLHIIGLYAQEHSWDAISKVVTDKVIKYPLALNWIDDAGSWDCATLPAVWIIGTDGKIKYSGKKGNDKILEEELAKVKFPGLGGISVTPELEEAAKAFSAMEFGKAYKLAQSASDKEDAKDETVKCAKAICERVDERFKALRNRAEVAEIEGNYVLALESWSTIERRFKDYEDAAETPAQVAKLKADKKVMLEVEATHAMYKIDRELGSKTSTLDDWISGYKKFAETYKGTRWAEKATATVAIMEAEKKAAEEEKKKAEEEAKKKEGGK